MKIPSETTNEGVKIRRRYIEVHLKVQKATEYQYLDDYPQNLNDIEQRHVLVRITTGLRSYPFFSIFST